MANSIKIVTIGAVAIAGLIFGGIYAAIVEALIALSYLAIKNA